MSPQSEVVRFGQFLDLKIDNDYGTLKLQKVTYIVICDFLKKLFMTS